MSERVTAGQQLERLLYVLPVAAREEGIALSVLAERLGIEPRQVLRELEEVTARAFYHPTGSGAEVEITIEEDRVRVWTRGELRRPVRLGPREALALGLGLRALAAEAAEERRAELLAVARRLERELASAPPDAILPRFAVEQGSGAGEGVRALLVEAARERRPCRIRYLKRGAPTSEERTVHPYVLVYASSAWYLLAHCGRRQGVRAFRLDRMLAASVEEGSFEIPADFDPRHYLSEGYVYRADSDIEVVVRYSPRIARWIREQGPAEEQGDGSVLLRHRVADPHWAVRHVLQFGADAEVLAPPAVREMVAAAATLVQRGG